MGRSNSQTPEEDGEPYDFVEDAVTTLETQWDAGMEELVYLLSEHLLEVLQGHNGRHGWHESASASGPIHLHVVLYPRDGGCGCRGFMERSKHQNRRARSSCNVD